jgi:hypothetical protein
MTTAARAERTVIPAKLFDNPYPRVQPRKYTGRRKGHQHRNGRHHLGIPLLIPRMAEIGSNTRRRRAQWGVGVIESKTHSYWQDSKI